MAMTAVERRILINQRSIMRALRVLTGDRKETVAVTIQTLHEDEAATLVMLKEK